MMPRPKPAPYRLTLSDVREYTAPRAHVLANAEATALAVNAGSRPRQVFYATEISRDVPAEMSGCSCPRPEKSEHHHLTVLRNFFAVYLWGVDHAIVQLGRFGGWLLSLIGLA